MPDMMILDLGATPDETRDDSNFFEKYYPWKERITIASIEDCSHIAEKYGCARFVENFSKQRLPFEDKEFDILFCSAVIEHVGTREDQRFFLQECLRVSKRVFITTPNRWFPIEMHSGMPLLHWLPWTIFQKCVLPIRGGFWADINHLNLLRKNDVLKILGNKVRIDYIRTLGFKSNLIIYNQGD